jgi:peptidoglycan/LPS O-acetylase OafA/YrhL
MGVVWFHCWWGTPYYSKLLATPILRQGEYGVHIFFVISGFLITTLLLREQDKFGKISLRDFYIRRALRIWPLYYATIAVYILVVLLFERGTSRAYSFFHYLPAFLTYTYTWFLSANWPPGIFNLAWTLCTEEQFYAFWPLPLRALGGRWSAALMVGLIALRTATGYGWLQSVLPPGWLPTRIVLSLAVPICLGALLAQVLHSSKGFCFLYAILGHKSTAPAALVALALCLVPTRVPLWWAWTATVALVGACVVREDSGLSALLRFRPMAFIGTVSYGMYLLNSLSVHFVHSLLDRIGLQHPVLVFPIGLGVNLGAAFLSYRYFEKPFLALKSRFSRLNTTEGKPSICGSASPESVVS